MKLLHLLPLAALLALQSCFLFTDTPADDEAGPTAPFHANATGGAADTTFTVNGVQFTMKYVEGGRYLMGEHRDPYPEQGFLRVHFLRPPHEVSVSYFWIAETEVTQELWQAVMGTDTVGQYFYEGANMPMTNITWDDCQRFIARLNELTGDRFRLPTEAEWEYAARGGNRSRHTLFAGSDTLSLVGWCADNALPFVGEDSVPEPISQRVAQLRPNELGLFDMTGNVDEWCYDWSGTYSERHKVNPTGAAKGDKKICRGGSTATDSILCPLAVHEAYDPTLSFPTLGMRLAR